MRVSTKADEGQAGGGSYFPAISADGRYVAFYSSATDLVPGDTNASKDAFRKDLWTGDMVRCSTDAAGNQVSGASAFPAITSDGRYVAFASEATTLVPGDSNGKQDIFVKDLQTGAVARCSTDAGGGEANGSSSLPSVSADGRYVAFSSEASDLVSGDSNGFPDIFRKDLQTGDIVRCSTTVVGGQLGDPSYQPSLSSDGRYVAFESGSSNLVEGDTNGARDIFRKDLQTGAVLRCSTKTGGGQATGGGSSYAAISPDGRYVCFESDATDLVPGDTNTTRDIFRKDLQTGDTVRCSTDAAGNGTNAACYDASLSADGRYVAFSSAATNLVPGIANAKRQVFRKNLQTGAIACCSTSKPGDEGNDDSGGTSMSNDGKYVAFDSNATNLVPGDTNAQMDVFCKELSVPITFYFAEGYTGAGFEEWLCLMNPGTEQAVVDITFMMEGGSTQEAQVFVQPATRVTLFVNDYVGPDKNVSARLTSEQPIVAERPMYFNYRGLLTGGHDVTGATSPRREFYFADGYTGTGFEEWLCLMNPNASPTTAHVTYMFAGETPQTQDVGIGPNTRATVFVNDAVGANKQVSMKVTSDDPIVAERPMYFNYQGLGNWNWTGGHDVMGAPSPATAFYFAEGYTGTGFEEWLSLQNPKDNPANVHITYMMEGGATREDDFLVPANSRLTISVNASVGDGKNVSTMVTSDEPIVAERPMYFDYRMAWDGGHTVMGTISPRREFYFAEGYTGAGFEEWLSLMNPNAFPVTAHVTYMFPGGTPQTQDVGIGPNTRATVYVNDAVGPDKEVSMKVTSDDPIVAERPMYFNFRGVWTGGHAVVGYAP
jgi:Tol biopolymer transport system component